MQPCRLTVITTHEQWNCDRSTKIVPPNVMGQNVCPSLSMFQNFRYFVFEDMMCRRCHVTMIVAVKFI